MGERVYAGLMLICLTTSAGLYFLPRRLSRERVGVMEKILHPLNNVALPLMLLIFGGSCLLELLGYQEPAGWAMGASLIVTFTILIPVTTGHSAAHQEISDREWAERKKGWEEGLAKLQQ